MPPSSDFSVAPDIEDFCPDFAVPAYSNLYLNQTTRFLLYQTFDETLPSRQSPQPSPALGRRQPHHGSNADDGRQRTMGQLRRPLAARGICFQQFRQRSLWVGPE